MNIVIKTKIIWHRKNMVGDGSRANERLIRNPTPYSLVHIRNEVLGFQIKYKYKWRVDEAAKRYAVRVLLI